MWRYCWRALFLSIAFALFCPIIAWADEAPRVSLDTVSAQASIKEEQESGAIDDDDVELASPVDTGQAPSGSNPNGAPSAADEPAALESGPAPAPVNVPLPPSTPAPQALPADGWATEGGKTVYYRGGNRVTGWLVVDASPVGVKGLERYWLNERGELVEGLIDAGSGWWAYAISGKGYVVRGMYRDPITGHFYYADNEGRLLSPGWHVTNAFGQGLQRYYIDARAHAAVPGVSSEGYKHFTRGDTGYVARGYTPTGDGSAFVADNDGRLASVGWVVTDSFGHGLQRYWISSNGKTTPGLIDAGSGWWAFGIKDGSYVIRGMYRDPITGCFYYANNDGRLLTPGWHVTDAFGQGMQRYYIDPVVRAAVPGVSSKGYKHFTRGDTGYVARGRVDCGDGTAFLADNDGRLRPAGWIVTDAFGQGLQRYYVNDMGKGTIGHFRVNGIAYYGRPGLGYVLRGKTLVSGRGFTQMALADNDGRLADFEGWLVTALYDGHLERYRLDSSVAPGFYGAHIGLFTLGGKDYYGREDQGYVVRELYRSASGKWYLGNGDGVLQPLPADWMDMYMMAQGSHSPTDWLILVDTNECRVGIYQYNYGRAGWDVAHEWLCTVGDWSSPTVRGTFYVQSRGYSFGHGYTCYYWTQFYGDYLFHSIKYYPGTFSEMDGRLGVHASLGCVRLDINNAAWIYHNIPRDTKVYVY